MKNLNWKAITFYSFYLSFLVVLFTVIMILVDGVDVWKAAFHVSFIVSFILLIPFAILSYLEYREEERKENDAYFETECPECYGSGEVEYMIQESFASPRINPRYRKSTCEKCNGRGVVTE